MSDLNTLKDKWIETRDRLLVKGLIDHADATLSLRCATGRSMWIGGVADARPALKPWSDTAEGSVHSLHSAAYALRPDVGAIALGSGPFGACLADFGGHMPQLFDEQARHIGPMAPPIDGVSGLKKALGGGGNALLVDGICLNFGTTCTRLALNMELFEKCAKAYVLAYAAGGKVKTLPWWVRRIANSRLARDQRRAAKAFEGGKLPVESNAY